MAKDTSGKRPWEIISFNSDNLVDILSSHERCLRTQIDDGIQYLYDYLTDIKTTTMLVENKYVDRDYLDDFTNYYAKCFQDYSKFCQRVHFFRQFDTKEFAAQFNEYLQNETMTKKLLTEAQVNYNGFVTVRPLPIKIIGRTVLKTYRSTITEGEDKPRKRSIRCVRNYDINLNGLPLKINSLGFLEQDRVVAACATSALWSAFQKTSFQFGYHIPGLYEITNNATMYAPTARPIPSHGLTVGQVCQAIRKAGLEPELNDVCIKNQCGNWTYKHPLLAAAYGYLRAGLPVLLNVEIGGVGHAITLAGYRIKENGPGFDELDLLKERYPYVNKLKGARIAYFYAHDDQIGPFCKLEVREARNGSDGYVKLIGEWTDERTKKKIPIIPRGIITPLYHKIRVPYLGMLIPAGRLSMLIKELTKEDVDLELDIFLSSVNDYKTEISTRPDIPSAIRKRVLELSHPRFFWRIRVFRRGTEICEMLADATDMEESFQPYDVNVIDEGTLECFKHYEDLLNPLYMSDTYIPRIIELANKM